MYVLYIHTFVVLLLAWPNMSVDVCQTTASLMSHQARGMIRRMTKLRSIFQEIHRDRSGTFPKRPRRRNKPLGLHTRFVSQNLTFSRKIHLYQSSSRLFLPCCPSILKLSKRNLIFVVFFTTTVALTEQISKRRQTIWTIEQQLLRSLSLL